MHTPIIKTQYNAPMYCYVLISIIRVKWIALFITQNMAA
jgi:hypothetical protein